MEVIMGLFKRKDVERELIELRTEVKLLREQQEKFQTTQQTMNKHIKFLVHLCKTVNPEFKEPED